MSIEKNGETLLLYGGKYYLIIDILCKKIKTLAPCKGFSYLKLSSGNSTARENFFSVRREKMRSLYFS